LIRICRVVIVLIILLSLQEHAVSIAHGYAKITGKPMAVGLHANVGLMHATMAIYNAFCDRVPMLILGATGPLDASKRRPWIDWLHTATDQAALIRHFIKFDDQPHSPNAAIASLVHATAATSTKPTAPVYVCLYKRTRSIQNLYTFRKPRDIWTYILLDLLPTMYRNYSLY
jgi:thiamine pyrophosphate-dependent acetolactate synthase large subunit-like protein